MNDLLDYIIWNFYKHFGVDVTVLKIKHTIKKKLILAFGFYFSLVNLFPPG